MKLFCVGTFHIRDTKTNETIKLTWNKRCSYHRLRRSEFIWFGAFTYGPDQQRNAQNPFRLAETNRVWKQPKSDCGTLKVERTGWDPSIIFPLVEIFWQPWVRLSCSTLISQWNTANISDALYTSFVSETTEIYKNCASMSVAQLTHTHTLILLHKKQLSSNCSESQTLLHDESSCFLMTHLWSVTKPGSS